MKKMKDEIKETLKVIPSWLIVVYCISIAIMNLLANKSINLPYNWLALDCGIIVSWVVFLVMDIVVKKYDSKKSIYLSCIAILASVGVSIFFYICGLIPGNWGESYTFFENQNIINTALDNTIKGNWFIIFGSSLAFFISTVVNAICNNFIGKKVKDNFKGFTVRSYISTLIGQITDNFVFATVVSHTLFGWTLTQCITCSLTGALVEALVELVFIPLGYKVVKRAS